MRDEYDFSNAEQAKFYIPQSEIEVPIYLDQDVLQYLSGIGEDKKESLQVIVNELLRKDIEIARRITA